MVINKQCKSFLYHNEEIQTCWKTQGPSGYAWPAPSRIWLITVEGSIVSRSLLEINFSLTCVLVQCFVTCWHSVAPRYPMALRLCTLALCPPFSLICPHYTTTWLCSLAFPSSYPLCAPQVHPDLKACPLTSPDHPHIFLSYMYPQFVPTFCPLISPAQQLVPTICPLASPAQHLVPSYPCSTACPHNLSPHIPGSTPCPFISPAQQLVPSYPQLIILSPIIPHLSPQFVPSYPRLNCLSPHIPRSTACPLISPAQPHNLSPVSPAQYHVPTICPLISPAQHLSPQIPSSKLIPTHCCVPCIPQSNMPGTKH